MSNRHALSHLRLSQTWAAEESRSLVYRSMADAGVTPLDHASKQTIVKMLDERYGVDHREEMASHGDDINHWLRQTELNLYEDMAMYVGPVHAGILDRLALGFIPHMVSNAFAEAVPHAPQEKVIGVNLGLLWVSGLLAEALLRAADGDEAGGFAVYKSAVEACLAQNQRQMHAAWSAVGRKADDAYLVHGGAVGSVVLRFVALHELGHVLLGHVGGWQMRFSPDEGRVTYGMSQSMGATAEQAMELEADAFALSHLLQHTGGHEAMWNNLLFIAAFFRLLAHLEAIQAIAPCEHHPPPLDRIDKLYEQTVQALGPPPNDAWEWAAQLQNEWAESLWSMK